MRLFLNRGVHLCFFATLLCFGSPLLAQDLNKSQQNALKIAKRKLDGFEKKLAKAKKDLEKLAVDPNVGRVPKTAAQKRKGLGRLPKQIQSTWSTLESKKCPPDHPDVKTLKGRVDAALKLIESLEADFEIVEKNAIKAIDINSYPDYKADLEKLQKLAKRDFGVQGYGHYLWVRNNGAATVEWIETRAKFYERFMTSKAPEARELKNQFKKANKAFAKWETWVPSEVANISRRIDRRLRTLWHQVKAKKVDAFSKPAKTGSVALREVTRETEGLEIILGRDHETAKSYRQKLDALIQGISDLSADTKKAAQDAAYARAVGAISAIEEQTKKLAQKKDLSTIVSLRATGIPRALGSVNVVAKLHGDAHARTKELRKRHAALGPKLDEVEADMILRIINDNRPPEDVYKGADAESVKTWLAKAWTKKYPKSEVLTILLTTDRWVREVSWRHRGSGLVKFDNSSLLATLVTKRDAKTAVMRELIILKDHLAADRLEFGWALHGWHEDTPYARVWIKHLKR